MSRAYVGVSGLLVLALLATASALAHQSPIGVEQLSPDSRELLNPPRAAPDAAPPAQISAAGEGREPERQVTAARKTATAPAQLAPAGKSAQPPQPLSRTAEGRVVATERLTGRDRCDPAHPVAGAARCAQVIENRAAEFARPRPELSPEQRLLVEQRLAERPRSLGNAMQRLATHEGDPDSLEAQAVAAVALGSQAQAEDTKDKADAAKAAADAAVVQAILNGGAATVQPPPK